MYNTFTKDSIYVDDIVVYLKNERTGSSTVRKCKFIGQVVNFTKTKVNIRRLSMPDVFVTPDEIQDFGVDTVCPDDVVHIIISKYQEDDHQQGKAYLPEEEFWKQHPCYRDDQPSCHQRRSFSSVRYSSVLPYLHLGKVRRR